MSMAAAEAPSWGERFDILVVFFSRRLRCFLFMALSHPLTNTWTLTNETKDVSDGGDKDDQGVGASQQDNGDDGVADPAELLRGAQELVDGGADLQRERERETEADGYHTWTAELLPLPKPGSIFATLTGNSTTGTVRVTAVSTARRTISRMTSAL